VFYEWRRDDPAFNERVLEAREQGLDALEDALVTRGMKDDTTAAIFLLKSHRRETYGDRLNVSGAITFADLHALAATSAGADDPRPGE
jgi:hypothetical protein